MEDFRFEQLEIWKEANQVSDILFDYADKADDLFLSAPIYFIYFSEGK
jgi:hypothetical protein